MHSPTSRAPWTGKHGPLLIAEIGGNHEGDYGYAVRLTDLAIESGADFVKFQLYRADTLVSAVESPERNAHFSRFELARDQHIALARRCAAAGTGYMASVWDPEMLEWIDPYLPIYKIGSGDLTAYPIIEHFARRGKPIILSTGLCTLEEVLECVAFIQSVNPAYRSPDMLALLQCTSMYPTAYADANLRAMDTLRAATGLAAGYSDHTVGHIALVAAAARGAQVLEFHFTDTREKKTFRDHAVSLTQPEVRELALQLDIIRDLLGDGIKRPLACEIRNGHIASFRRAVYSKKPLRAGEVVRNEDLVLLRPLHGVDARQHSRVAGTRAARALKALQALELSG